MGLFSSLFGSGNNKKIKDLEKIADKVEGFDESIKKLSDQELRAKTDEFRDRLEKGETLDDLLPEAFAVVREAGMRTVGMRHFHVQIIGGIVLHQGRIAEMKTGEGKTLVATLPAYLNALAGKGVHVVTVNDYLAKRDSQWMGKIYKFLGLTVGLITQEMNNNDRKMNYGCDITYGTNNQFGFDYLRDNMVVYENEMVQRGLDYAIIDEVDSILIDEARTPLIISGQGDKSTDLYTQVDKFVKKLKEDDFDKDEKKNSANLTDDGVEKAEKYFNVENLSDLENTELNHHINQGLAAHFLKHRDKDYVVQDGEVLIVDEFTGRLMNGRRYSNGLHQAIEAKEGVKVEHESKTLATITFQNYFRMYRKLSGMTGTAATEEDEFNSIYGLDVVIVPTNENSVREDKNDMIFIDPDAKYRAVIDEVIQRHANGQPILVGTVTVEDSEYISSLLRQKGIKHNVLNAKNHTREAEIVAQAGKVGAVTIATNMAGRGTDILLGGNPDFMARRDMLNDDFSEEMIEEATSHAYTDDEEILHAKEVYQKLHEKYKVVCDEEHKKVVEAGGLFIVGTQRHESRRIDNQLRGRSGRQGDPGVSVFYVSMKDDLMRLFGGEWMHNTLDKLAKNGAEDVQLQYGMFSKRIEGVQKKVELHNLEARKQVLKYDDVMNQQREIIYNQRRDVLKGKDLKDNILSMMRTNISEMVNFYITPEIKNFSELEESLNRMFDVVADGIEDMDSAQIVEAQYEIAQQRYEEREAEINEQEMDMREIERIVLLQVVDRLWMDHIDNMDQLRQGIGLRAFAQRDPLIEYTMEGFEMFEEMSKLIQEETVTNLFHVRVQKQERQQQEYKMSEARERDEKPQAVSAAKSDKVGRNDPCTCGSGKKYKNCCGK